MKKLLITLTMVALTISMTAQETWQITRMQGLGVKSAKMFFTLDQEEIKLTIKGKVTEEKYVLVADTGSQVIFDGKVGVNDARYTLTRSDKHASIQYQYRDSFSGETTTQLWMIKKVK